jgi:hypothetical protein
MHAVLPLSPPTSLPLPLGDGSGVAVPPATAETVRMTGFAVVFDSIGSAAPAALPPLTPDVPPVPDDTLPDPALSLAEGIVEVRPHPPEPSLPFSAGLSGQPAPTEGLRDTHVGMGRMAPDPAGGKVAKTDPVPNQDTPLGNMLSPHAPKEATDTRAFPDKAPTTPVPVAGGAASASRDMPLPVADGRADMMRLRATPHGDGSAAARSLSPPASAEKTARASALSGAMPDPTAGFLLQTEWAPGEAIDASLSTPPQDLRRSVQETVTLHRMGEAPPPAERQIAAAISASTTGRTDILLDPQELGRVRLSLEGDETALVLTIQAERSETADLLRRHADLLLQEFRDAGYANLTFSFADPGQSGDQTLTLPDEDGESFAAAPPEMLAGVVTLGPGTGTLDLRL